MLKGKEQLIGTIVTIAIIIWGILEILFALGAFVPKNYTVDSITAYLNFSGRVTLFIVPIVISALALVPLYNEDDEIISTISYALAIIYIILLFFTSSSFNEIFINLICCDILILIVYTIKTSSMMHRIYKIIICIFACISIFMSYTASENALSSLTESSSLLYGSSYSSKKEDEISVRR